MRRFTSLLALLLLVAAPPLLAQTPPDPPLERGFHADSSFQIGDIDNIDLARGSLQLLIPIGQSYPVGGNLSYQLKLSYHSDIWDIFKEDLCPLDPEPCWNIVAEPSELSNSGFGFMLHLASLVAGSNPNSASGWKFIGSDGAEHTFEPTLHDGETAYSSYGYTRDGSYLRWVVSSPYRYVETPDGTKYWFEEYDVNAHKWRLTEIEDTYGNNVEVAYDTAPDPDNRPRWTISDSTGRTHTVLFDVAHGNVDSVVLAAFDGATAEFSFEYDWPQVRRSCLSNDIYLSTYLNVPPVTPGAVNTIPFLTTITLPDGSTYKMLDGATPTYYTNCVDGGAAAPGVLKKLWLPTGGAIAWAFDDNRYVWEEVTRCTFDVICARPNVLVWSGVSQRDLLNSAGNSISTWGYSNVTNEDYSPSTDQPSPEAGPGSRPEERRMVVTAPDGNDTVYYFMAYPGSNPYATNPEAYGLPFTTRVADPTGGGRYLSKEAYLGTVTFVDGVAQETPERTTYVSYELDELTTSGGYRHANRHLVSERTVYEDGKYTTVTNSGFDGLGHFSTVTTAGDFGAGDVRETTTNYNPNKRYPADPAPAEWWPRASPWVINTYTETKAKESNLVAKTEVCFDATTGALLATRALKDTGTGGADPSRHANDVLARFTRDGDGNVTGEEYHGGDTDTLSTGALCNVLPFLDSGDAAYRIAHTYQYGRRRTTRYLESNGTPLTFYTLDLDNDQNTGLPAASYQASTGTKTEQSYVPGIRTQFLYDTMGRLTWEKPDSGHGAYVHHQYLKYNTCSAPAKVESCTKANGTTTECVNTASACSAYGDSTTRSAVHFDGHGRPVGEFTKYTSSYWNQRLTEYDAMNRKASVSEWQASGTSGANLRKTTYSYCGDHDWDEDPNDIICDPFGRVLTITPPDGSSHDIAFRYTGVQLVERKVTVATSTGGETDATTTETYDRQGRLVRVTEASGYGAADVDTEYTYDVGNRLSQASTTAWVPYPVPDGQDITQNRVFTYDNRGFLLSEQLPELGASGNGTVTYSNYDPRGHALRRYDGLNRLRYEVDRAERVSKVRECDASWQDVRILRQFAYATANSGSDKANGKLYQATANTLISTTTFPAVETYTYAGVGGRVSRRRTVVDGRTIDLDLTWNDLGRPASITYPNDTVLGDPSRTVSNAYSWGMLTGVTSYTTSISYHPNLMVNAVAHANGATVTYAKDDNDMRRPKSVATTGTASNWSSGTYGFDGAGNVKAIGSDWYTYDKVSRLTVGTTSAGTKRQCATYNAFGTITALGIGTTGCSPSEINIEAASNHMAEPVSYNAAGAMLDWTDYSYTWDPLGQMASVYGGSMTKRTFLYTADGERIEERIGSNPLSPTSRIIAVRGLDSKVLRLFTDSGGGLAWTKDYVYREGLPLASVDGGGTKHFHLDHLGTIRRITGTGTPAAVVGTHDYYPFGLEATDPTQDAERLKFTGHERDQQGTPASQVDDLDYMHARYYNFNIARFLSVDPGRDNNAKVPQSWNLYSYVRNNPVTATDPDGRVTWFFGALIGGGAEYGIQVVSNLAGGAGFRSFVDVDGRKIAASAALGALTSGLSGLKVAGQGLSLGTRALIAAAGNLGEAQVHATIEGQTLSPLQTGAALVTGAGGELGGAAGQQAARELASGTVKELGDAAKRLANIAADGRPRPAQTERAAAAAARATEYGAGTVAQTAQEVARKAVDEALERKDQ